MIFAFRYANDPLDYFVLTLLAIVAVVISICLHEVAHGLVAKWNGDYTAKYAGRLTLNPVKHFDPIGFTMMMFVGFGYAKPVPVNPVNFKHYRRGLITVSIAGIVMNLILAFIGALYTCLMTLAFNHATGEAGTLICFYLWCFGEMFVSMNITLAFFNLLPLCPLDGFRLVESLCNAGNKFVAFMRTNGQYILWGLVGLSFIVQTAVEKVAAMPGWFGYLDILGTYLNFFAEKVSWLFYSFWGLMVPVI